MAEDVSCVWAKEIPNLGIILLHLIVSFFIESAWATRKRKCCIFFEGQRKIQEDLARLGRFFNSKKPY